MAKSAFRPPYLDPGAPFLFRQLPMSNETSPAVCSFMGISQIVSTRARLLFMCISCAARLASAQTSPAPATTNGAASVRVLSLAQAREISFEKNWDLLAVKSGIDSASAQLIIAKEFPNPIASLSTYKIGTYEASTAQGNGVWNRSYDTIAAVAQLIEVGGKRRDRQLAGRAGIIGAKARFYDAKRTLDQGVTKAYVAALLAGENVEILGQSSSYMRREAEVARARFQAGDLDESDLEQILVSVEQYELQESAAAATARQARVAVDILLGVDQPRGDWQAVDSLEGMAFAPSPNPSVQAGSERPDVVAAHADLQGGQAQLKLQKAVRIPDPTISVGVEHEPPSGGPPVDTFNIGVSFPLPVLNRNGGNIAAAQAAVDQFTFAFRKAESQAVADIANAEVEYKEAAARLKRYREEISPQSDRSRKSVAYSFENGGATLVDLLEAERTDNDVRIATAQAKSDTASAVADVQSARNVIVEKDLKGTR